MAQSKQRPKAIQDLMQRGNDALNDGQWFTAETLLAKALGMLRSRQDWGGMAEALTPLHAARKGRRKLALASRVAIALIDEAPQEGAAVDRGRSLFQPPVVAADARRFRLAAMLQEVPVAVVCREPTTRLGEIPVVAIAPGATIRVRIDPPKNESKPTAAWFRSAMDALAKEAVAMDQPDLEISRRVDRLLALVDAVPEGDAPTELLIQVCTDASLVSDED
jgi:hypothetical protein